MLVRRKKKAQVWGIDLLVALIIFIVSLMAVFFYSINYGSARNDIFDELSFQAGLVSDLLLSEDDFGLLVDGRIDQTRLDSFDALSDSMKKSSLGVVDNFYINMTGLEISGVSVGYVGIVNAGEVEDLVKVTRIVIYKNKPTKFEVFVWR